MREQLLTSGLGPTLGLFGTWCSWGTGATHSWSRWGHASDLQRRRRSGRVAVALGGRPAARVWPLLWAACCSILGGPRYTLLTLCRLVLQPSLSAVAVSACCGPPKIGCLLLAYVLLSLYYWPATAGCVLLACGYELASPSRPRLAAHYKRRALLAVPDWPPTASHPWPHREGRRSRDGRLNTCRRDARPNACLGKLSKLSEDDRFGPRVCRAWRAHRANTGWRWPNFR